MKKFLILVFLFVLGSALMISLPVHSQDVFPTSTPSPSYDYATYEGLFVSPTPVGTIVIATPGQPLDLEHVLDHDRVVMVNKLVGCADRVNETGEDCTTWQGQQIVTIKSAFPKQGIRVSGDDTAILTSTCPTDAAERQSLDAKANAPVRFKGLFDQAIAKLGVVEPCLFAHDLSKISGAFYHTQIYENTQQQVVNIAIICPSGCDISTFVMPWGSDVSKATWDLVVSVSTERVVLPPQFTERFEPDGTNVPNCSGSLLDMAKSVNPAATTVEELFAALHAFVGDGCPVMNITVGQDNGSSVNYLLQGVYARNLNPAFTDLGPYLVGLLPVVTQTATATPSS